MNDGGAHLKSTEPSRSRREDGGAEESYLDAAFLGEPDEPDDDLIGGRARAPPTSAVSRRKRRAEESRRGMEWK
jgi:hypothetical protein